MADQQEDKFSYPIPAILLIIAIVAGGIFKFYAPLNTLRPPLVEKDYEQPLGEEDVLARMWQDPFQAVENHIRYRKAQDGSFKIMEKDRDSKNFKPELDPEIHSVLILPVMITAGCFSENIEERLRSRYAVLSALHVAGYQPKHAEHIGYFERAIHGQPRTIPYEWFTSDPLPVNSLLRERMYDAVLVLWLGDEYFEKEPCKELGDLFEDIQKCFDSELQLLMKVLGPTNSADLKEIVSEALPDTGAFYNYIKRKNEYLSAKGDLERTNSEFEAAKNALKDEIQKTANGLAVKFEMYSPWATADPLLMMIKKPMQLDILDNMYKEIQTYGIPQKDKDDDLLKEDTIFKLILKYKEVNLQRSIHTDHELTDTLVEELSRRIKKIGGKDSGDIVLVSDWDTFYGRALPVSFIISLLKGKDREAGDNYSQSSNSRNTLSLLEKIHVFNYMRGIDGVISNEDISSRTSPGKSTDAGGKNENRPGYSYFMPAFEQPFGQDQFDYIRRLTNRIIQEYTERKVIAIGVLGNDIYDKLLILRALREQFPGAIFFTTDLDARLFHYTELPWTRNLIVASSYGLQLHHDLQGGIPPFRSVYQSSLFAAALQALGIVNKPDFNTILPRIFEIGIRGAYDLTPVPDSRLNSSREKALHPDRRDVWSSKVSLKGWRVWEWISDWGDWLFCLFSLFFLPVCVFGGLCYYNIQRTKNIGLKKTRRWKKNWIGFFAFCVTSFCALTVCAFLSSWNGDGESITFFDGISIWPTELLRLSGGLLALYFLFFSIQALIFNRKRIRQFFPQPTTDINPPDKKHHSILTVWKKYQDNNKRKNSWLFIGIAAGGYLAAGSVFIWKCGEPLIPYRGELSWWVDICILFLSLLFMLILIAFVINTTWLCIRFIKEFIDSDSEYIRNTPGILSAHCSLKDDPCRKDSNECKLKYAECLATYDKQIADDTLAYWFTMKIIGEKTRVIGEMIKYPFLILFLLLVSRHKYFDNWTWTAPLAMVIGLTTMIALACTMILFSEAKRVRKQMISGLREELLKLINTHLPENIDAFNDKKSKLIEQRSRSIESVMNEIRNIKNGAFSPAISLQNPIIMAILTPLGGMGTISLFQQLAQLF
ncbi:MAG: hypothetical protein OZ917_00065 [Candidatus Brocadiaceae bacterium]|nr:hypothetical protein [Candidatus Brocadiaceae bacterium]